MSPAGQFTTMDPSTEVFNAALQNNNFNLGTFALSASLVF